MDKLLVLLMILLFAVGVVSQTLFKEDGIQKDADEMQGTTHTILVDVETQTGSLLGP